MLATLRRNLKNFVSIYYYGFIFLITGNSNGLETIMRCSRIVSMTSRSQREESLKNSKSESDGNSKSLTATVQSNSPPTITDNKRCEIHSIEIKTLEIPN